MTTGKGGCRTGFGKKGEKTGAHAPSHAQQQEARGSATGPAATIVIVVTIASLFVSTSAGIQPQPTEPSHKCDQTPFWTSGEFGCFQCFIFLRNRNSQKKKYRFTHSLTLTKKKIRSSSSLLPPAICSFISIYYDTYLTRLQKTNK